MLDIALKNLWARKTRSILTVMGVAVCIMLFLFMVGTTGYVEGNMEKEIANYTGQIYVKSPAVSGLTGAEFPPVSSVIDNTSAARILEETPGINREKSIPILFRTLNREPYPGGPRNLAVCLPAGKEEVYLGDIGAAVGSNRFTSDTSAEAIIGKEAADYLKVEWGKTLSLAGQDIPVRGILEDSGIQAINLTVFLPLQYAQSLFRQPDSVSAVLLTASSAGEVQDIVNDVKTRFPKLETMSQADMAKSMDAMLTGMHTFFGGINAVAALVAVVVVLVVMFMAVSERTREIGTLRAIGARKRTILGLIVQESFFLSLLGGVLGVPLGFLMNAVMYKGLIVIEAVDIPQGFIVAIVAGILGGIYPAWRATRVNPLQALRYE
jgi:putative ABC transport system permease protein